MPRAAVDPVDDGQRSDRGAADVFEFGVAAVLSGPAPWGAGGRCRGRRGLFPGRGRAAHAAPGRPSRGQPDGPGHIAHRRGPRMSSRSTKPKSSPPEARKAVGPTVGTDPREQLHGGRRGQDRRRCGRVLRRCAHDVPQARPALAVRGHGETAESSDHRLTSAPDRARPGTSGPERRRRCRQSRPASNAGRPSGPPREAPRGPGTRPVAGRGVRVRTRIRPSW